MASNRGLPIVDMRKLALLALLCFLSTKLSVRGASAEVRLRPTDVRNGAPHDRVLATVPWEIVGELPHDKSSFTQGLTYHNGILFEGTGLYGRSRLRRIDPTDGSVMKSGPYMSGKYFGEGIAHYTDRSGAHRIIQLTWRKKTGFLYTPGLLQLSSFAFQTTTGEGWGITHDGDGSFVVSDGSQYLHFWDDATLTPHRRVAVTHNGKNISNLNELEYVDGRVLANVWYSDNIYVIDPTDGRVLQVYDFSSLYRSGNVLNGIALTGVGGELFITGKQWPVIYRIRLTDFWGTARQTPAPTTEQRGRCVREAVAAHESKAKKIRRRIRREMQACDGDADCRTKLVVKLRKKMAASKKQMRASLKTC